MTPDKYNLISRPKEELVAIIEKLTEQLNDEQRLEFLAKWISPQAALDEIGGGCDGGSFLEEVEAFCNECMSGDYYYGPGDDDDDDYEDYDYYDYDEEDVEFDFGEGEWIEQFAMFLKLAVIYSKNGNYDTAYTAFEKLMGCIDAAESDEEILGTEDPTDYIKINWPEVFAEYYLSMKNQLPDAKQFAGKAVDVLIRFGERCDDAILNSFDNITHVEQSIQDNIAVLTECWPVQHRLYELLNRFYIKLGLAFNEVEKVKPLVRYNPYFKNDLAQGYMNRGMWDEAVLTINGALKDVRFEPLISDLKEKLIDCYERLNRFEEAYGVAVEMFTVDYSHELYIKARGYAVKLDMLQGFIKDMEENVRSSKRFDYVNILLRILSYEGYTAKLIDTALKAESSVFDLLQYVSKSLVYRALSSENIVLPDLKEFLQSIEEGKIMGITDMVKTPEDSENKQAVINGAVKILKLMVQSRIDAAQREQYARAAYYCAVIKDIYTYLNEDEEFTRYYVNLLNENNRRSALKDEMKIKMYSGR
ncbi:MAG: hypothetical protein ACYCWE_02560 [Eubacteriales bacterium]